MFSDLTIKILWWLHHVSTKASVTVLKHAQKNSVNFKRKKAFCSQWEED